MKYSDLKQIFQELKRNSPKEDLTAHIIFTEDSFDEKYGYCTLLSLWTQK